LRPKVEVAFASSSVACQEGVTVGVAILLDYFSQASIRCSCALLAEGNVDEPPQHVVVLPVDLQLLFLVLEAGVARFEL